MFEGPFALRKRVAKEPLPVIEQKPPKTRALDALVGTAIAAVVIAAATFGDLGPARHTAQANYAAMQASSRHHLFRTKPAHAKARCLGTAPCLP